MVKYSTTIKYYNSSQCDGPKECLKWQNVSARTGKLNVRTTWLQTWPALASTSWNTKLIVCVTYILCLLCQSTLNEMPTEKVEERSR